ncbi:hypothetical protein Esi_1675_0001 [Ectocarpus siliculosus]|uniref:Uncharacterized protein n=1 Tax=Ectocarpus siliculosus TaxID=2880 RepID=D7FMD6_ECTSI|nr:hypothetical protein Esi_1675_0001 [Ectocarpus siliculosus]|eukprot:CBJ34245.1 hypothetical protein Esi_1675_0001 [Ectocarpus siliculosus]
MLWAGIVVFGNERVVRLYRKASNATLSSLRGDSTTSRCQSVCMFCASFFAITFRSALLKAFVASDLSVFCSVMRGVMFSH